MEICVSNEVRRQILLKIVVILTNLIPNQVEIYDWKPWLITMSYENVSVKRNWKEKNGYIIQ